MNYRSACQGKISITSVLGFSGRTGTPLRLTALLALGVLACLHPAGLLSLPTVFFFGGPHFEAILVVKRLLFEGHVR